MYLANDNEEYMSDSNSWFYEDTLDIQPEERSEPAAEELWIEDWKDCCNAVRDRSIYPEQSGIFSQPYELRGMFPSEISAWIKSAGFCNRSELVPTHLYVLDMISYLQSFTCITDTEAGLIFMEKWMALLTEIDNSFGGGRESNYDEINDTENFATFWAAYPKKVGKQAALTKWKKLKPSVELRKIMLSTLKLHKQSKQWQKNNGEFIPHAATWIGQRRWEDELEVLLPTTQRKTTFNSPEADAYEREHRGKP